MSFFKSLIDFVKHEDYDGRIERYEQLIYPCKKCKQEVDISQMPPLVMKHCPKCNELFLVPMQLEDWWVCQPLGGGGMGAVYLGRHRENADLKAAVKVLQANEQVNQTFLDLLIQEAQIAAQFGRHANLAQVYTYGHDQESQEAYMIMELIEGIRFDKAIGTGASLDETIGNGVNYNQLGGSLINEELAMYYLLDILTGLEHMFQCGYLYRDLKPENLIIRENHHVALVDYGLCMTINDAWYIKREDIMGSPLYMPPERISCSGEDFRADLYALGMVIYHAIMGAPYFSQTELMKIIERQWKGLRVQTKFKMERKNEKVIEIIDTLINIDRDKRYQSYHEIRYAVHEALMQLHSKKSDCKVTMKRRQEYIDACLSQT
ncbi:MAG: serine/threonine protein kinase [Lentisphaerales bacterium]|nr:serine/threonine protein kinase [Lentisphaerales bacterium]